MSLALERILGRQGENPMAYLDLVFRYTMARLGQREEAEDIAIETVQALPNPCYRRDLKLYMLGMARRKIADRLRRMRATLPIHEHEATTRFDGQSDQTAMIHSVLHSLNEDHREALTLKYIVGMTSTEIGRLVGKRADAVDSMLQRARDAFAREWALLTSDEVIL